ncbi:MAG: DHH family phosphoesterase, partial [candidate division FCPU426 bacterium]
MLRRWKIREQDAAAASALSAAMELPPILGRVLSARGYRSAEAAMAFLDTSLSRCHDPWSLDGMRVAVERASLAIRNRERIVIFGDYDVDGVTSSALLVKLFRLLGGTVEFYIPDRLKEGYGPNVVAFRALRQAGATLVITVDCGINAVEEAKAAREMGLDLIVTDHHLPGPVLPDALAVINP